MDVNEDEPRLSIRDGSAYNLHRAASSEDCKCLRGRAFSKGAIRCAQPRDAITTAPATHVAAVQLKLSPLGLTANKRDRNVPHGRIGFGAHANGARQP